MAHKTSLSLSFFGALLVHALLFWVVQSQRQAIATPPVPLIAHMTAVSVAEREQPQPASTAPEVKPATPRKASPAKVAPSRPTPARPAEPLMPLSASAPTQTTRRVAPVADVAAPQTDAERSHPAEATGARAEPTAATGASTPPSFSAAYLSNPEPTYPAASLELGESGQVLLRVVVSAEGRALSVELAKSSGFVRLDRAARQAVKQWRFAPARRGSEAVEGVVLVPIQFQIKRQE